MIVAAEIVKDRQTRAPFAATEGVGAAFCNNARAEGLIVRAIGDVVAMSPPLIITSDGIKEVCVYVCMCVCLCLCMYVYNTCMAYCEGYW